MTVVFLYNDFRVYWKGKLYFLQSFFDQNNIKVHVLELFGTGSPYTFDEVNNKEDWWECLFETQALSGLSKKIVADAITKRLDEINPDFIICGSTVFMSGAIGLRWGRKNNKKVIIFDDVKFTSIHRNAIVNFVKKRINKLADGYLVPSKDYDREYLKWGIASEDLYYGLNCVDNSFFSSDFKKRGLGSRKIICVARLVPIKNLTTLLQSWRCIEDLNQDYQLLIIGDGPEYETLNSMANELKLLRVKFLGMRKRDFIAKMLASSDAFILPSFLESWGMVVNEAMAAGLPVLLSDRINAGHTLLEDGVNGYSFNPYDGKQMSNAILRYINLNEEEKIRMSSQALLAIKKYDYKYLGEQLLIAISKINDEKTKRVSWLNYILMALWSGKFKSSNWDTLK